MRDQAEADRALVQAGTQKMLGGLLQGARLDQQTAANVKQADQMADAAYLGPPMQVPIGTPRATRACPRQPARLSTTRPRPTRCWHP